MNEGGKNVGSKAFYISLALFHKLLSSQTLWKPKLRLYIYCTTCLTQRLSLRRHTFPYCSTAVCKASSSLDADYGFHLAYKLYFAPTEQKSVHLLHLGTAASFQQQRHWFKKTKMQPWKRILCFSTFSAQYSPLPFKLRRKSPVSDRWLIR